MKDRICTNKVIGTLNFSRSKTSKCTVFTAIGCMQIAVAVCIVAQPVHILLIYHPGHAGEKGVLNFPA